jgi:hypothetical protein
MKMSNGMSNKNTHAISKKVSSKKKTSKSLSWFLYQSTTGTCSCSQTTTAPKGFHSIGKFPTQSDCEQALTTRCTQPKPQPKPKPKPKPKPQSKQQGPGGPGPGGPGPGPGGPGPGGPGPGGPGPGPGPGAQPKPKPQSKSIPQSKPPQSKPPTPKPPEPQSPTPQPPQPPKPPAPTPVPTPKPSSKWPVDITFIRPQPGELETLPHRERVGTTVVFDWSFEFQVVIQAKNPPVPENTPGYEERPGGKVLIVDLNIYTNPTKAKNTDPKGLIAQDLALRPYKLPNSGIAIAKVDLKGHVETGFNNIEAVYSGDDFYAQNYTKQGKIAQQGKLAKLAENMSLCIQLKEKMAMYEKRIDKFSNIGNYEEAEWNQKLYNILREKHDTTCLLNLEDINSTGENKDAEIDVVLPSHSSHSLQHHHIGISSHSSNHSSSSNHTNIQTNSSSSHSSSQSASPSGSDGFFINDF